LLFTKSAVTARAAQPVMTCHSLQPAPVV